MVACVPCDGAAEVIRRTRRGSRHAARVPARGADPGTCVFHAKARRRSGASPGTRVSRARASRSSGERPDTRAAAAARVPAHASLAPKLAAAAASAQIREPPQRRALKQSGRRGSKPRRGTERPRPRHRRGRCAGRSHAQVDRVANAPDAPHSGSSGAFESGRRGSNPRHSAWKADALPLSYARSGSGHYIGRGACAKA